MSRKIVLGLVAVLSAAACIFLVVVLVRKGLTQAGSWAVPLGALAGIVAAAAAVWAVAPRQSKVPLPAELKVPDGMVDRPAELSAILKALTAGPAATVGITTALYGAGGFGKTTLAQMVCADRHVRRRFRGRVYMVTVGRDVRRATAIAAKINDVIKLVAGEDATFTDPELAGRQLGSLLDAGPRRLLVLDDVWMSEQLAPLSEGGKKCARLVTTRVPELLAGRGTAVQVDQMSPAQARALLTSGLPTLDSAVVQGLLNVTGRWPLLLRLVNKILADYARVAADVSRQGAVLLARLRAGGPAVVDDLLGETSPGLDVDQSAERARAVWATIGASTSLLDAHDTDRFAELAIFAEDETIPFSLVAQLWQATAGLDDLRASQVCQRLAQLALVSQVDGPERGIAMHDVVRDYLRAELGQQRLAELTGTLLDAVADRPAVSLPDLALGHPARVAWWEIDREHRYLWDHLVEHLLEAGRPADAEAAAVDLRWVGARLEQFGPAAPAADLSAAGTPRAARLRTVLTRTAHLLAPTEPAEAVVDVLHSRVADDPDWGPQATALGDICSRPRLVNRWPVPDLADPALRRVLVGRTGMVTAVVVAPDGSWLAASGQDGTVRIWDVTTGRERATLKGRTYGVTTLAVAPDGSWLASNDGYGVVRIWDVATGQKRTAFRGHRGQVGAVAVAPDGSWLASGGQDGTVRIWPAAATGRKRAILEDGIRSVTTLAVAPDGSWLASGSTDGVVRIWDVATGRERATLEGRTGLTAMATAPDGSWLACGSTDGTVRIWDLATGREQATLKGHNREVTTVAVALDGSWLASGSTDGVVRIWDVATGRERTAFRGHRGQVEAVAVAPDGSWLASGSSDGTVRIWDAAAAGRERATLKRHTSGMRPVVAAPDGSWLACGSTDGTVRIWDVATGRERATLKGHTSGMRAVVAAPDGSWLASGSSDGTVRIWDVATGRERASLKGHNREVTAVVAAPDGSWLASASTDGTVRIWDLATGRERATLKGRTGLVAAPDGSWLACADRDGTVRIWDVATGRERASLKGHNREVTAVVAAPDGSWLASASTDGTVRIWDLATGRERATLKGRTGLVAAPDGSWLACADRDGTVRIWDVATGRERATLKGHTYGVTTVAVAPDGSWLACVDWDGTVRIWDVSTGRERATLKRHTNEMGVVVAAPDGSWLACGGRDGTVRIWDVATMQARAMMRVDGTVHASMWVGSDTLAISGSAGLYLFGFFIGTKTGTPLSIDDAPAVPLGEKGHRFY